MLKASNISVHARHKKLVDAVSFELDLGQLMVIAGANGAGKSTLLKTITGELSFQGEVLWKGKSIPTFDHKSLAQQMAVMSQSVSLNFDFTVREVVMMGRYPHFEVAPSQEDRDIVNEKMKQTGLSDKEDRIFQTLSGGEQQRVHFARALAQVADEVEIPQLLILDEPLNNLDVKYQFQLMDTVKQFVSRGNMAIMVVHDLNIAAQFADVMLLLKEGRRLKCGTVQEVFTEETLTRCFDFNTVVQEHPTKGYPMAFFDPQHEEDKIDQFKHKVHV